MIKILPTVTVLLICCLASTSLSAQKPKTSSKSKSKTYTRTEKDGKVEEKGDSELKSLVDKMLKDAKASKSDSSTKKSTSSHSKRVEVKNGKTVVDEESRHGKPVKPGSGAAPMPNPPFDMDELMRRAKKEGTSSKSSSSKRVVNKNGKKIVDEETKTGKPVKSGSKSEDSSGFDFERALRDSKRHKKAKKNNSSSSSKSNKSKTRKPAIKSKLKRIK